MWQRLELLPAFPIPFQLAEPTVSAHGQWVVGEVVIFFSHAEVVKDPLQDSSSSSLLGRWSRPRIPSGQGSI